MQRKSFIQHLSALGAFGFLPAGAIKYYKRFYLLQCFAAGFRYYKGMEMLDRMKEGDMLELVREADNEYDDCAIALHWNREKIGFLPASENGLLSRLLDAEALDLTAEITHLNKTVQPWENLSVAIYFLKETTQSTLPVKMEYLTQLETPHYTAFKNNSNTVTKVTWETGRYEEDFDWAGFLKDHSRKDSIQDIIMNSDVSPTYKYGSETGEYLLLNINRLPEDDMIKQLFSKIEQTLGSLDNLFDEQGYITLTTSEAAALIPKLERIANVTDKLGRHFIELGF